MSGVDGSILAQLELVDPDEAMFLAEELDLQNQENSDLEAEEEKVYTFNF